MGVAQTRKGRVADAHGKKTRAPTAREPAARPFVAPAGLGCRAERKRRADRLEAGGPTNDRRSRQTGLPHGRKTRADRLEAGGLTNVRRSRRAGLPHGKKTRAPTARKPAT